jgi:hypothetical protein
MAGGFNQTEQVNFARQTSPPAPAALFLPLPSVRLMQLL